MFSGVFPFPFLYKTLILYNCSYLFSGSLLPTFVSQELVEKKKRWKFSTFFSPFSTFFTFRKARTSPSLFARGHYYYLLRVGYIYYIYLTILRCFFTFSTFFLIFCTFCLNFEFFGLWPEARRTLDFSHSITHLRPCQEEFSAPP